MTGKLPVMSNFIKITICLFSLQVFYVDAALIGTCSSGDQFEDLGDRTKDCSTNLVWLDVTETFSRSYDDVLFDINNDELGGDFSSGIWSYAYQADFRTLISNFFGAVYSGGFSTTFDDFADGDATSVELFISLFGDSWTIPPSDTDTSKEYHGNVTGWLGTQKSATENYIARVMDNERTTTAGIFTDGVDHLKDSDFYAPTNLVILGSFLISSTTVTTASEPTSISIMILSLLGLLLRRAKTHSK